MRILYLSCHSILEYDEIKLLRELGHHVFSPGDYVDSQNQGRPHLRPDIRREPEYQEDWDAFHSFGFKGRENKDALTKSFVDRFDAVLIMHLPKWIHNNWEAIKHKPVIWRTIGQSSPTVEAELKPYRKQGLRIIRYSPAERRIPGFLGEDGLVRFYKDPDEFCSWRGDLNAIMTVSQFMPDRKEACYFELFKRLSAGFRTQLFGPGNEAAGPVNGGELSYDDLKNALRSHRGYLYTGTYPASYTLSFIEAWMTGIPIITPSRGLKRQSGDFILDLDEVPDLICHEHDGLISDDPGILRESIEKLLRDQEFAKRISAQGRNRAIELFGKNSVKKQWSNFFTALCLERDRSISLDPQLVPTYIQGLPFDADLKRRIQMTAGCGDCDVIEKDPNAGAAFEADGYRYQVMHNGLRVLEDGYHGRGQTEIIRVLKGHHEPQEEKSFHEVLKLIRPGSTMVELGSHWSYYSLWFQKVVPGAINYMIEPDPSNLGVGMRNFEINKMRGDFTQASIGKESFPPRPFHCESDNIVRDIRQTSVDDFFREKGINHCEMLFCDIQGYELQMLQGATESIRSGKVRFVFISTHHYLISNDPIIHHKCIKQLKELGAHLLVSHTVSESYSGDGLIVGSFYPSDRQLPEISISRNYPSNSLFREVEFDLAELKDKHEETCRQFNLVKTVTQSLKQELIQQMSVLSQKENEIGALQEEVSRLKTEWAAIQASRSWKLALLAKRAGRIARRFRIKV